MSFLCKCSVHRRHACPPYCEEIMRVYAPDLPNDFLCPIAMTPLIDPVIDEYGFTYSREAIKKWLGMQGRRHSPMTGQVYSKTSAQTLVTNIFARSRVFKWWEDFYEDLPAWRETPTPTPPCPSPEPSLVQNRNVSTVIRTASEIFARRLNEEVARIEALLEREDPDHVPLSPTSTEETIELNLH